MIEHFSGFDGRLMEDFPQQNVQQTHSKFRIEQKKFRGAQLPSFIINKM